MCQTSMWLRARLQVVQGRKAEEPADVQVTVLLLAWCLLTTCLCSSVMFSMVMYITYTTFLNHYLAVMPSNEI